MSVPLFNLGTSQGGMPPGQNWSFSISPTEVGFGPDVLVDNIVVEETSNADPLAVSNIVKPTDLPKKASEVTVTGTMSNPVWPHGIGATNRYEINSYQTQSAVVGAVVVTFSNVALGLRKSAVGNYWRDTPGDNGPQRGAPNFQELWEDIQPGTTYTFANSLTIGFSGLVSNFYTDFPGWNFSTSGGVQTNWSTGVSFNSGDTVVGTFVAPNTWGTSGSFKVDAQRRVTWSEWEGGTSAVADPTNGETGALDLRWSKVIQYRVIESPAVRAPTRLAIGNVTGTYNRAEQQVNGSANTLTGGFTGTRRISLECIGSWDNVIGGTALGWYVNGVYTSSTTIYPVAGQSIYPVVRTPMWNHNDPYFSGSNWRRFRIRVYKGDGVTEASYSPLDFTAHPGIPDTGASFIGSPLVTNVVPLRAGGAISQSFSWVANDSPQSDMGNKLNVWYKIVMAPNGNIPSYNYLESSNSLRSDGIVGYESANAVDILTQWGGTLSAQRSATTNLYATVQVPDSYSATADHRIYTGLRGRNDPIWAQRPYRTLRVQTRAKDSFPSFSFASATGVEPGRGHVQRIQVTGFDEWQTFSVSCVEPTNGWGSPVVYKIASPYDKLYANNYLEFVVIPKAKDFLATRTFRVTLMSNDASPIVTTSQFTVTTRAISLSTTLTFTATSDSMPNDTVYTNSVTVSGIDDPIQIGFDSYDGTIIEKQSTMGWVPLTSSSLLRATINASDVIRLRSTTALTYSTLKTVLLKNYTVSGTIGTWNITTSAPPTGGVFSNLTNLEPLVYSTSIATPITGFTGTLKYTVTPPTTGWDAIVNSPSGILIPGSIMSVSVRAPFDRFNETKTITVTTDGYPSASGLNGKLPGAPYSRTFTATTRMHQPNIAPVSITSLTAQFPGDLVVSSEITLDGFDLIQNIECENGLMELVGGDGNRVASLSIRKGVRIKLYTNAPMDFTASKAVRIRQTPSLNPYNSSQVDPLNPVYHYIDNGGWVITTKVCDDLGLLQDL